MGKEKTYQISERTFEALRLLQDLVLGRVCDLVMHVSTR